MRLRAVHRIMVRRSLQLRNRGQFGGGLGGRVGRVGVAVSPHHVQNGRANETVLDGAGEEEGTSILHQRPDDVRTSTFVYVVSAADAAFVSLAGFGGAGVIARGSEEDGRRSSGEG